MNSPRLKDTYLKKILPQLIQELKLTNPLSAPRITKLVINVGLSEDQHQDQALTNMSRQLALTTGQKPALTQAKRSIAEFKIRAGDPIGLKVTLRGRRMYQFLDKLISTVLPQIKDFQGVSPHGFDGHGNYTLGLKEQIVFPELDYDTIDKIRGLEITLVTSASTDSPARKLLQLMGVPFAKE